MNRREFLKQASIASAAMATSSWFTSSCALQQTSPNIVFVYADDLGYGDVSCYGATDVHTPNIDRLAAQGIRFTDAYATSATCTPSRYSLLTGEYAWRREDTGIASGDAPLIIPEDKLTLADMLHEAGYISGVVGKWHLGLGRGKPDWNGELKPGPLELGFDYCYLVPATGDRVPCVYVENHRVVNLDPEDPIRVSFQDKVGAEPTGVTHPELLKVQADRQHSDTIVNGISRIGYMSGGQAARWKDEEMADVLTDKAVSFITTHKNEPFFLFFSLHDIHVPRAPHPRFVGATQMGPRGDAIVQLDWCVGELVNTIDELGLAENTMIIVTSDNGPVLNDGYEDQAEELVGDHKMSGPLRGGKYSSFEAGTRVPFVVRWSGQIQPAESRALISQVDCFASFAALTGRSLKAAEARDSVNILPSLLGTSQQGRQHVVQEAMGRHLSLRQGKWKYIPPRQGDKIMANKNIETGRHSQPQLYNLETDIGETQNVADAHPQIVADMQALLERIRESGHRNVHNETI